MTNKQIKEEAFKRMKGTWGDCVSLTVLLFAMILFLFLCDVIVYLASKYFGFETYFLIGAESLSKKIVIAWAIKLVAFCIMLVPETYMLRRFFIDIARVRSFATTRQYMSANLGKTTKRSLGCSLVIAMLKLFAAVPMLIGIYGVYYWGYVFQLDNLTSSGLFMFMISMGATVVCFGLWVKYCVSLVLAPYIIVLNPRANVFDACDLSCKIMDGRHIRYFSFIIYNIKYFLLCVFIYPAFAVVPFFQMSYTLFIEDIMGQYWQDKYPLIIERWKKRVTQL